MLQSAHYADALAGSRMVPIMDNDIEELFWAVSIGRRPSGILLSFGGALAMILAGMFHDAFVLFGREPSVS